MKIYGNCHRGSLSKPRVLGVGLRTIDWEDEALMEAEYWLPSLMGFTLASGRDTTKSVHELENYQLFFSK